jgi:hypothetical protein
MKRIIAFIVLGLLATPAFAWGALGHRLVADLADDELSPAARRAVGELLAGEKEPTLAGIATWADALRANDPGLGRRSAPWHYVGLHSPACDYAPADCPDGNCVVGAIRAQAAILADRQQPIEARRTALRFVVHFIGDAHQPLHANNRDDKGGNTVQLRVPAAGGGDKGSNLHSLWDSGLMQHTGMDEAAYHAHLRTLPVAVDIPARALPPQAAAWVEQSCRITLRPGLYPPSPKIGEAYYAAWTPLVDEQLRRAGTHLAQVLNAALGR